VVKQVKGLAAPSPLASTARRTHIIGHRGSPRRAPENTLCSVQLAMSEGADGVEVDICVTRDGHIVLWHDRDPNDWASVARQTGLESCAYSPYAPERASAQRKPISQLSREEFVASHGYVAADPEKLKALGLPCPERVAAESLDTLAEFVAGDVRVRELILDVKLEADEAVLADTVLDNLQRLQTRLPKLLQRRVKLLTPQREVYEALRSGLETRQSLSSIIICADFERPGVVATAREIGARDVSIGITASFLWPSVREEIMEALALRDADELDTVSVWTSNKESELFELMSAGVDAVLVDDIPLALRVLDAPPDAAAADLAVQTA
jgi:glycerophosphoryl diester phosphodiesterase